MHLTTTNCSTAFFFAVKETDRLSLVTYDTHVYLNFNLLRMTKENKEQAKTIVTSLTPGSRTNLCEALLEGTHTHAEYDTTVLCAAGMMLVCQCKV